MTIRSLTSTVSTSQFCDIRFYLAYIWRQTSTSQKTDTLLAFWLRQCTTLYLGLVCHLFAFLYTSLPFITEANMRLKISGCNCGQRFTDWCCIALRMVVLEFCAWIQCLDSGCWLKLPGWVEILRGATKVDQRKPHTPRVKQVGRVWAAYSLRHVDIKT